MDRKMKQEKLAKQISLALMAGMVTYTPVAFGMPVQDTAKASTTGVEIKDITNGMGITSTAENNVIYWTDFSIEAGKTVKFDYDASKPNDVVKNHNYANIVTGAATSFIDGIMEGGNNVYLINPNGVIFGKGAEVNVGNLYVSTQGLKEDETSYEAITGKLNSPFDTTVASDVVNLGTIKADKVEVVGNNIRFLNATQIRNEDGSVRQTDEDKAKVTINAQGYIHVGHEGGMPDSGYTANKTITEYQLVKNLTELGDISNGKNYMLANDIDGAGVTVAPISSLAPTEGKGGNFDGMFYEIKNLNINSGNTGRGIFASASGGVIENVGLRNITVTGFKNVPTGGLVGDATNETIRNVYNTGTGSVSGGKTSYAGGLVGQVNGTVLISDVYNTVNSNGGGIVGNINHGTVTIENSYNTGSAPYGFVGDDYDRTQLTIINSYYTGTAAKFSNADALEDGKHSYIGNKITITNGYKNPTGKQATDYSGFDISDVGGVTIDSNGKVTKPTWRIYAGQSLPMLTAFFKGTVQADYTYSMGNSVSNYKNTQSDSTLGITSYDNGNILAVYNAGKVTIDNGVTEKTFHGNVEAGDVTKDAITDYANSDKISYAVYDAGKKNADRDPDATQTYAMFTSGQLGYDIAGSNFTIEKRVVSAEGGSSGQLTVSREYANTATYDSSGTTTGTLVMATYDEQGKLTGKTGLLKEDEDSIGLSGVKDTFFNRDQMAEEAGASGITDPDDLKTALDNWYVGHETEAEAFKDGSVGKNKYVRITFTGGSALSDTTNYWLDPASVPTSGDKSSVEGTITPKTLTLSKNSGIPDTISKVYDGKTALEDTYKTLNGVFTLDTSGVIGPDNVSLDGTAPTEYGGSNAGEYGIDYSKIKLAGAGSNNYRIAYDGSIIYCGNGDFAVNKDSGATVTLDGKITPREINVSTAFNTVTKTYDGTASAEGVDLTAKAPSGNTGVISADKDKLVFTLGTGAKFKNDAGTEDASTVAIARKVAGNVTVSSKPGAGNVLKNYKFSGNTDAQTLDVVNTAAFNSEGNITRRNLDITIGTTTGIDKEYDGTNAVADTYTAFGGNYAQYADGSAHLTGNDGVTISVGAVYDSYDSTKDADGSNVYRGTDRSVLDKDITYTVSVTGAKADNYTINSTDPSVSKQSATLSATGKINPIAVTTDLSEVMLAHTYNGKSSATSTEISSQITGTTAPITRVDTGAEVSELSLDTTNMSAVYYTDSKRTTKASHAGTGYTVQYDGLALSGTGNVADNYDFSTQNVVTSSGNINAKTINNLSEINQDWAEVKKQYDGTTDVYGTVGETKVKEDSTLTKSNVLTLYNTADKDDEGNQLYIAFQIAEAAYANKNVDGGTGTSTTPVAQKITYKVKLTGDSANDYDFSSSVTQYDPTTKELTVATVANEDYGTITPIAVSLSSTPTGLDKVYDGKTDASAAVTTLNSKIASGEISLVGVLSGETVKLSGATSASYASKNVDGDDGSSSTEAVQNVTFSGVGLNSGNYVLSGGTVQGTGTIRKLALKVIAADGISKQYDGVSDAGRGIQATDVIAPYVTLKNGDTVIHNGEAIVTGETFDVTKIDANYGKLNSQNAFESNANAGANKVQYASLSSTIANVNNYTLQDANGNALTNDSVVADGSITKRNINATDIKFDLVDSITKTYDGTDLVEHTDAQGHHTADEYIVGNAPYVLIEDMDNDGNADRLSISDFTVGEAKFGYVDSTSVFHASKNVDEVDKAAYEISFGEGALDNFDVTGTVENLKAMTTGSITKRALVISAVNDTKTYNGTTASDGVVTANNLADYDTLTAVQTFDNPNVQSTDHVISVAAGYTIKDANDVDMTSNYNVTTLQTAKGVINPAPIKVQFKDVTKDYDGTTAVTDANRGLDTTTTGTIAEQVAAVHTGDDVSLTEPAYGNVNNVYYNLGAGVKENEGKTNNVTYTGLKLTGAKAGNYILANVNGTALEGDATNGYTAYGNGTIAKKVLSGDLTITFDAITKTYNNDVDVVPDTGHATVDKYITSAKAGTADLIYSVSSASYKQKDAGTGLDVDFTLQVNKDNYDLSGLSGVTADGKFTATATGKGTINKKTVTASMADGSYNKTYDGTTVLKKADGSAVTAADLRNLVTVEGLYNDGSDVTVSGKYDYKDAGDRTINYLIASNDVLKKNYTLTGADSSGNLAINKSGTISKATMSATDVTTAIRAFDGTTKAYNDTNGGNQEISLTLTGVNGESLVIKNSDITDDTKHFAGNYGTAASTSTENFEPDSHVAYKNNAVAYKSVKYDGISAAAGWIAEYGSEEQKGILKNYNITDTAYFSEAQEKGKIMPLAVTAAAVKSKWNAITKVYDGKDVVDVTKNPYGLKLYMEVNGNEVPIEYTTASAVYDDGQVDVADNLGVTYTLAGINGQYSGDYSMSDEDKQSFVNKVYKSTEATDVSQRTPGSITKRGVYVAPTATTPEKVYDATDGVDNPSQYIEIDKTKVVPDTGIIGTDDVSVVVGGGKYDTADAGENKDVTYSNLSLDGTKAGNYKLLNADGTDMTASDTVIGKGKINPYEIAVALKDTVNDIRKVYDAKAEIDADKVLSGSNGDGTGRDLVFTDRQTGTPVAGGTLSIDGKTMTYKPTAGAPIVVEISSAFVDSNGNEHSDASEPKELGVNYYLKWNNENFKLVRTDGTDLINPTHETDPVKLSATLRGENMGTITQREINVTGLIATKPYDGTKAVGKDNLDIENMTYQDYDGTALNHDTVIVENDTIDSLELFVTGGEYAKSDAATSETEEYDTTNTVSGVTIATNNKNYKIIGNTSGQGIITRREITAAPTNIITDPGETPQFSGTMQNVLPKDGAMQEDFVWDYDGDYHDVMDIKGKYDVYAYYKDASGNKGAVADGNYGLNYKIKTQSANEAWQVGNKPAPVNPVDPSNPDSPYSPLNPNSPFRPNSDMNTAIAQASKFKPDDKSYNRASHDDNIEHFGQQSSISIQYEDTGVNVGDEEAVVGKRSLIGIESAGNVVNLGDAEMHAGSIGIESNGVNLGPTAEQAAIEAGLPATESYEAVPAVTTAEQEDAVVESPFLSRLRQGQSAASDESNNGEVSTGISIITADPEDEDEEEKKNRAALMARSDRETHIGIETIGSGVNMAAAAR